MRKLMRPKKDKKVFRRTAAKSKKININPSYSKKYIVLDGANGTQRQKKFLSFPLQKREN